MNVTYVYKKVLDAVSGRDANDFNASLIATNTLVVLMLRSDTKVSKSISKVFSFGEYDTAPAIHVLKNRIEGSSRARGQAQFTIVYDNTWLTVKFTDLGKYINNRLWV